jgi:putative PIN family toxin of toxin-antitoxin system
MRVVVDTNVLISGIFHAGAPYKILAAWADGHFEIVASEQIITEYCSVLERLETRFPTVNARPVLDRILRGCEIYAPDSVPAEFCDDPDDLMFIACALAGSADGIVSGDKALLRSSSRSGVAVWKPREFLDRLL